LKTTVIDYLLSTSVIGVILSLSLAIVWMFYPLSMQFFRAYHVLADMLLLMLTYGVLTAAVLRCMLALRPMPSGNFGMDSKVFTYWKLLTVVYRLGQTALWPLTPVFFRPVVEMLYGARIGRDVALGGVIDDPYQVTIGPGCVIGFGTLISGNYISDGALTCGPVVIGSNVTVGANSVVFPGTQIGDNAVLMGGSYVMPGTTIPTGQTWRGNPARKWM
jgi:carbonic anhydrase/acetyltransferase-like protein (isoleucine patch superfamily)